MDVFGQLTAADWNAAGHAAGVLLFGTFLVLAWRRGERRRQWLSFVAVAAALTWNLASLAGFAVEGHSSTVETLLAAVAFCAVSALPAVLLHLLVGGRFPQWILAGYGLSLVAILFHISELATQGEEAHRRGLQVITVGFGIATSATILRLILSSKAGDRALTSRALGTMSLFLFAVSFTHFSGVHVDEASADLLYHHAGIPLALFVLLQDYRFVFADAFVRVVANGLMAIVFGWGIVELAQGRSVGAQWLIAGTGVGLFGLVRMQVQTLLARLIFRQPAAASVEASIEALRALTTNEDAYLTTAGREMARLMSATLLEVAAEPPMGKPATIVPVRLSATEARYLLLSARRGGRPYMSMDLDILERLASVAAAQVSRARAAESQRLVAEAELRALQAQINPHFLFNALNTLYGMIPRQASAARQTTLNLASLFRYFLRTDKALVPLEEELETVRAYLAIEEQRLGARLKVEMDVAPEARREPVPVLSIQPLVENAIKHGVAANPAGGVVRIEVTRREGLLHVAVADTGAGEQATPAAGTGVGLENVTRRLRLHYGPEHSVKRDISPGGTTVEFTVPVEARA